MFELFVTGKSIGKIKIMLNGYHFSDEDITITSAFSTTCGIKKHTKPLYDAFFQQLVKQKKWVSGETTRWNLWALASYADMSNFKSGSNTKWPNVVGVIVSYENLKGATMVSSFGNDILCDCQAWTVETSQQSFVVNMHVFVTAEKKILKED